MASIDFKRGIDLYDKKIYVKSGLNALDTMLEGGLEPGLFYILYGNTRINDLFYPIITSKISNRDLPIFVIDCNNWFNPYNLNQDNPSNNFLKNIYIARAFNWNHFKRIVSEKIKVMIKGPSIIFVVGLNTLFPDNKKSKEFYSDFVSIISQLKNIATPDNIVLATYHGNSNPPHFIAQYAQIIIFVCKNKNGLSLVLEKHPSLSLKTSQIPKKGTTKIRNLKLDPFMR